jgi:hypothetical protein
MSTPVSAHNTSAGQESECDLEEQLMADVAATAGAGGAGSTGDAGGTFDILTTEDIENGEYDADDVAEGSFGAPEVDAMAAEIVARARAAMAEMDAVVRGLDSWRDSRPVGVAASTGEDDGSNHADDVEHELSEEKYEELVRPATSQAADASVVRVRQRFLSLLDSCVRR